MHSIFLESNNLPRDPPATLSLYQKVGRISEADILAQAKVPAPSQIIRNSISALRSELRSE